MTLNTWEQTMKTATFLVRNFYYSYNQQIHFQKDVKRKVHRKLSIRRYRITAIKSTFTSAHEIKIEGGRSPQDGIHMFPCRSGSCVYGRSRTHGRSAKRKGHVTAPANDGQDTENESDYEIQLNKLASHFNYDFAKLCANETSVTEVKVVSLRR